jgi:hypothetical protein
LVTNTRQNNGNEDNRRGIEQASQDDERLTPCAVTIRSPVIGEVDGDPDVLAFNETLTERRESARGSVTPVIEDAEFCPEHVLIAVCGPDPQTGRSAGRSTTSSRGSASR